MKMCYFERYEKEGEYFVGKGKRIGFEINDDFKNSPFRITRIFQPRVEMEDKKLYTNNEDIFLGTYQSFLGRVEMFTKRLEKDKITQSTLDNALNTLIGFCFLFLGPVGKNDYVKEGNIYICRKFKFDKEWFKLEYKRAKKLGQAFFDYHGFTTEINDLPSEFLELERRKYKQLTNAESEGLKELSRHQIEIICAYYSGEKLSKEELNFFNKINQDAVRAIRIIALDDKDVLKELTPKEEKRFNRLITLYDKGVFEQKVDIAAKQNEHTRTAFIDALNDSTHNIREIRSWDKKHECFVTEQIPINCFGYFVLFVLQSLKTNKGYYNCEGCGHAELFSHKSIKMCEPCKTAKRKRKSYIKKDMLQGLSFEEIVKKHPRTKRDELQNHYKELKKELNM